MFLLGVLLEHAAPGLGKSGWQMLVQGFLVSTVAVYHGTSTINSLSHVFGRQRYRTGETSRNNLWLAIITLGAGWHNHHPASAYQGFYWWEFDITFYLLKLMTFFGLIWHLKPGPAGPGRDAVAAARAADRAGAGGTSLRLSHTPAAPTHAPSDTSMRRRIHPADLSALTGLVRLFVVKRAMLNEMDIAWLRLSATLAPAAPIEMIEAVGHQYLDTHFRKCGNLLRPEGAMLLQVITICDQMYESPIHAVDFIKRCIFPGGDIPSARLPDVRAALPGELRADVGFLLVLLRWTSKWS